METLTAVLIGVLFATGLYLMLRRNAFRLLLGLVVLAHAVNLMLFVSGGLTRTGPPIIEKGVADTPTADPLPQALILTAIVIALGVQAFVLVLIYRLVGALQSPDIAEARITEEPAGP